MMAAVPAAVPTDGYGPSLANSRLLAAPHLRIAGSNVRHVFGPNSVEYPDPRLIVINPESVSNAVKQRHADPLTVICQAPAPSVGALPRNICPSPLPLLVGRHAVQFHGAGVQQERRIGPPAHDRRAGEPQLP